MAPEFTDPRMTSIKPRIRYNTIGGVNGPLVFLDNVCYASTDAGGLEFLYLSRSNFRDIMRLSL